MNARKLALYLLPLAAFVVLAAFLMRGLWLNPREVPSPLIGKPAPVFERPKLHTPEVAFASKDMAGQVWIFNVWASWCTPCRQEHPLWNEVAAKKLVPIVGMNYKDQPEAAKRWLAELGDPYLVNVVDRDGRLGIDFGVYGVPETFVIDKQGVIRHKHIGPITAEALQKKILPLVRELQQKS
ncbi:MAG: DsbE family thiol:disulfide interchange protein [Burkholderiaceae bacterium]|nr:DsbE family thiol:disulfide interchange protein [Burkholderiaceae bacterium]